MRKQSKDYARCLVPLAMGWFYVLHCGVGSARVAERSAQVAVLSLVLVLGLWTVANFSLARRQNKLLRLAPIWIAIIYLSSSFLPHLIGPRAFAMTGFLGLAVTLPRIARNPIWGITLAMFFGNCLICEPSINCSGHGGGNVFPPTRGSFCDTARFRGSARCLFGRR